VRRLTLPGVAGSMPRQTSGDGRDGPFGILSGLRVLSRVAYLRNLALLVLLGAVGAALLDYMFKVHATETLTRGGDLMNLFSWFYIVAALLAFVVQMGLRKVSLERLGLAPSVATLPAAVGVGSLGAMLWPGLVSSAVARGGEMV